MENTVTNVTSATDSNPVTTLAGNHTPKTTIKNLAESGIAFDQVDGMMRLVINPERHESFFNKKGDVRTYAKVSNLELGNGFSLSLTLKGKDAKLAAIQLKKDITRKVKLYMREKATEKDITFLLSHGFANEDGTLDEGAIESKYADICADDARAKAVKELAERNAKNAAKVAELNGSLQKIADDFNGVVKGSNV